VNAELLDFESDEETNDQVKPLNWAEFGFIKPLDRIIMQLLSARRPSLICLYKMLVSMATGCSAEWAMSRVRIIKNRLRSKYYHVRLHGFRR